MKAVTSVEDYLVDMLNQKYAKRIFQKINTEWESKTYDGSTPKKKEYEWMIERALELHRGVIEPSEVKGEEEDDAQAKD